MEIPLLKDVLIIFGLSIGVLLVCHRFRIPSIVGFLITGVISGPEGLGLVKAIEEVKILAEIGIIVLLFTVGLEFSLKKVWEYKRYFLIAGPMQVGLSIIGGFGVAQMIGRPLGESLFLGFLLSLSSTAIVMRTLQERAETDTPHGKLSLGILIFQDVAAVLMMLVTPMLAASATRIDGRVLLLLAQGVLFLVLIFFSALRLVPWLLHYVAKTRSRELFLLTVFVICIAVAWVTANIGLSLALGAFLAGLIISESEYSEKAMGNIIPFQDVFTSFFFVSIGMLLDIDFFLGNIILIVLLTAGILIFKAVVVTLTALTLGIPVRTATLSGMALSQVGEFAFVLSLSGIAHNIGSDYLHQLFISIAVLTMGLTPVLIAFSPYLAAAAMRLPLPSSLLTGMAKSAAAVEPKKDHVIIAGYGYGGRNLSRTVKEAAIPYVIIDMNPERVREERLKGEPIYFGDATSELILKHANIQDAKVLAVLINDMIGSLRVVELARHLNPALYIIVRTRHLQEMKAFLHLGADDVVPDELYSSVEVFTQVLGRYEVDKDHIGQLVSLLRTEGYQLYRPRYAEETIFSGLKEHLSDIGVKTLTVREGSAVAGRTLEEAQLRSRYGITVLGIKRGEETLYNLDAKSVLKEGDKVILVGEKEKLSSYTHLFTA